MEPAIIPERSASEMISLLVGQVILELHKQGKAIQQPAIVNALRRWQETEKDETQRFYLTLAVGLLSL